MGVAITVTAGYFLLLSPLSSGRNQATRMSATPVQLRIVPPTTPKTLQSHSDVPTTKGVVNRPRKTSAPATLGFTSEDNRPGHAEFIDSAETTPEESISLPPRATLDLTPTRRAIREARGVGSIARDSISQTTPNDARSELERALDHSHKPDCMSSDALRHEPPQILGVGVSGILVIPSWLKAAATGKCKSP